MMRICLIYGGKSVEHEISIVSANSILNNIDRKKYQINGIYITRNGSFKEARIVKKKNGLEFQPTKNKIVFSLGGARPVLIERNKKITRNINIDIYFPVVHGTGGEDGSIQGLLKTINKPYVGSNTGSSAICMDKILTKRILTSVNIQTTSFIEIKKDEWREEQKKIVTDISSKIKFPCFVKAANLGSSVGIYKVKTKKELILKIRQAFTFSTKIFIEEAVINPDEIEVSVLGNQDCIVSSPGLVIPSSEFYDYKAKYIDGESKLEIPFKKSQKNKALNNKIRRVAIKAYTTIGCEGMARVDFLYGTTKNIKTPKLFISEINTIPGFTPISMYPKLLEYSGITYKKLIDSLITLAIKRYKAESKLKTNIF
ncbi:MAG: D-alanine--D-alanine ligase family protein [Thermodesulfobacteriota bacterium]|nr:D-alanine--D-alanine ligase family protein [Thermodesulfobacteriota bacterium]